MFARYSLPVHFGVVDGGHRTCFAQMSHCVFDMSCSILMKTTNLQLPEGASMNCNVSIQLLQVSNCDLSLDENFYVLREVYSQRIQSQKERTFEFSLSVFFLGFIQEAQNKKLYCDYHKLHKCPLDAKPIESKNGIVKIDHNATFWHYRYNLMFSFNKYAFKKQPFRDWVKKENLRASHTKVTEQSMWDLLIAKKLTSYKFTLRPSATGDNYLPTQALHQNECLKDLWGSSGVHAIYWIVMTLCWQKEGLEVFRSFVSSVSNDSMLEQNFLVQHISNPVIKCADHIVEMADHLSWFGNRQSKRKEYSPKKGKLCIAVEYAILKSFLEALTSVECEVVFNNQPHMDEMVNSLVYEKKRIS